MEYFKNIDKIKYEGKDSRNPLAFKWYDENLVINNKTLKEHLKFAVAYWHSFCQTGSDPFGQGTIHSAWNSYNNPTDTAKARMDAAFEFITKLGTPFYCFHDTDLVGDGSVFEIEKRLGAISEELKQRQDSTNIELLWGTANLFSNPRYMNGAATNPDFRVVANAAVQVKNALDITKYLNGSSFVFWGGREGYQSLLNTNMKKEKEHMAVFLKMARDYGRGIGFTGDFLIEPKPMEPMKHQYDYDAATTIGFLKEHGLEKDFKLNIEVNHAILAGHTFQHELQTAVDAGLFASIDANKGDYQNGWDTDEFPTNIQEVTEAMITILQAGGFKSGGINFDAKLRRNSVDSEDLFIAHINGMDTFARALIIANSILEDSDYLKMKKERYASFELGDGNKFENGKLSLEETAYLARSIKEIEPISGKQELYEAIINMYI